MYVFKAVTKVYVFITGVYGVMIPKLDLPYYLPLPYTQLTVAN